MFPIRELILFAIFGLLGGISNGWAAEYEALNTETLRVSWRSIDQHVTEWQVDAASEENNDNWKSLVTKDTSGIPLSRHLHLDGIEIEPHAQHTQTGKEALQVETQTTDGRLKFTQRLSPAEKAYRLNYSVEITNLTDSKVTLPNGIRLVVGPGLGEYPAKGFGIAETLYSFVEPVAATADDVERFHLIEPRDSARYPLEDNNEGLEWFGLHSRYFALLIAPRSAQFSPVLHFHINEDASGSDSIPPRFMPDLTMDLGIQELGPGESVLREFLVFSGPKSASALQADGGSFGDLLFSGLWQWMRGLSIALLWVLDAIHSLIPSWGIAIILLAILVRLLLYPVAKKALVSQKAFAEVQKKIQPEMHDIKQRYSGGEQSEMILELYERHDVSPLAGLKPLLIVLIQIPIFVALFHALGQAYELKDASFLWIDTLAEPDRLFPFGVDLPFFGSYFNVLPVIMAVTTLLTIKFSPAPTAEESSSRGRNIFYILMAFGFFVLFYPFPSGMVLYWTMANMLHLLQQVLIETNKAKEE